MLAESPVHSLKAMLVSKQWPNMEQKIVNGIEPLI